MEKKKKQTVTQTKLEKLNLVDKFLFDETMEDVQAYEAVVSILLENEIRLLEKPKTEKELRVSPQLRAVRLDVVGMGQDKKIYYTEMQKSNTGNLKKRSRYYQAQMDVSLLEPGTRNFNLLSDSCMILVAPFDIFGRGLYRYTFEGRCRECPDLSLQDGATRVFINIKGTNREDFSQEFLDFMEYLSTSTEDVAQKSRSNKIQLIHRRVEQIRISEKAGVRFMQRWEEVAEARDEGKAEGEVMGREMVLISQVCKKLSKGKNIEKIAEELETELLLIQKICDAAKEFAPLYDEKGIYDKLHEKDDMDEEKEEVYT